MNELKEPLVWEWGFTFLCPHCATWNSYLCPRSQPVRLTRWIKLSRTQPDVIAAILVCEDCGGEVNCSPIGVVAK